MATFLVLQQPNGQLLAGGSFVYSKHKNGKLEDEPAWELYAVTNHSNFLIGMIDSLGMKIIQAYEWELIRAAEEFLFKKDHTVEVIWSDVPAVVAWVYKNHGWQEVGEKHLDEDGKPRQKMFKRLINKK